MRYPPCTLICALSLIRVNDSFVHSSRSVNTATQRRLGVDDNHQTECITCPTLLTVCQFEHWHKFCDDVDKVLEYLVSPAPESFHVLHSLITKINEEVECFDEHLPAGNYTNDFKALSKFLIKSKYTAVLFLDSGLIRWKIEHECSNLCNDIQECKIELYHKHNTLELSRIALDLSAKKPNDPETSLEVHHLARQAEKRLTLTMGSDLRGTTASDACFNFSLAGLQDSYGLFRNLICVGIHEIKRIGRRASFKPKNILHMVEKVAACDIQGQHAIDLYHAAGECLETKGYDDAGLIESLKGGTYGFHCPRPLIWLWRVSSRQKKLSTGNLISFKGMRTIDWGEIFHDPSKPIVVDVGSGLGASLLNLSVLTNKHAANVKSGVGELQMAWSDFNYVGVDLNQAFVNFGNGIVSRDPRRVGRVRYFCNSAENLLSDLLIYTGMTALIMINFPSPYRLKESGSGNSQLPSMNSSQFMVNKDILEFISRLLAKSDDHGCDSYFLFQTKCEDVAVLVKNECLALGTMEYVPCKKPMKDVDLQYKILGKRPKRVDEWLTAEPLAERAEGIMYSSTALLPILGQPETEVQCIYERTVVHRLLFRRKQFI